MTTDVSYHEILKPFEYTQVLLLQKDDPWCREMNKRAVHERKAENGDNYHGVCGLLFERKNLLVQDKLLLPHAIRDHLIRKCHVVIDHRDAHDTYVLLTRLFCFERMLQNTNRIVRECLQCS